MVGGSGDDVLIGSVTDGGTAAYHDASSGIVGDLSTGVVQDGNGGTDTLIDINTINGSDHNDAIFDSDGDDNLHGNAGDDVLVSGAGQDFLTGDTFDGSGVVRIRLCLHRRMARRGTCRVREASLAILFRITRRVRINLSSRAWKGSATRAGLRDCKR